MHAKNLIIDHGSNWEDVKAIREGPPYLDIVPSFHFIVKSIYSIDTRAFMVSPQ